MQSVVGLETWIACNWFDPNGMVLASLLLRTHAKVGMTFAQRSGNANSAMSAKMVLMHDSPAIIRCSMQTWWRHLTWETCKCIGLLYVIIFKVLVYAF